ncbi:YheC/YheD family protein [Thalassobacillus sp. C254]|uniref:YheC/YheD family protein n=1 Tax=Thalassobacillus sp. C254 TaxID=1225341 RepID=UPI0006D0A284|nr:YheC/YheD family protein [Thalassobacillus sp. C254]
MRLKGRNKYKMHAAMRKNNNLKPYLPRTVRWSKANFYKMLKRYKSIVVKPNNGKKGRSIYFIKVNSGNYVMYINRRRRVFKSKNSLYQYMRKKTRKRRFNIQPEIKLAKIKGRPVDFRVIVQRKSVSSPWTVTGMIARKAGKGYKVTNRHRNGRVLPLRRALKRINIKAKTPQAIENDFKQISLLAANTLGAYFPRQRIFAVDIGMDRKGSLYIFELNRWPGLVGFKRLKNKSQIRRIRYYLRRKRKAS